MKTNDEIADDFEYMYSKMYSASQHATAAAILTVGAMLVKHNQVPESLAAADLMRQLDATMDTLSGGATHG